MRKEYHRFFDQSSAQAARVISGGQILFQGKDILRLSDKELSALRWSEIAMVFQSAMNSLNPVLTIQEQFADVLRHHQGLSNEQAKDRAEKLLDLVNIPRDRLGEYPHQFSGGMRQRLVIAIALSLNPSSSLWMNQRQRLMWWCSERSCNKFIS